MFGIGMQELMIILVVALLVLGPTKLPTVARTIGKGMREIRRASDDLRTAMMVDLDEDERPRRPTQPPPAPALPTADGVEPAIQGSVVAGAEAVRAAHADSAANADASTSETAAAPSADEGSLVRAAPGIIARGSAPDPDDANDHAGMPDVAKATQDLQAQAASSAASNAAASNAAASNAAASNAASSTSSSEPAGSDAPAAVQEKERSERA